MKFNASKAGGAAAVVPRRFRKEKKNGAKGEKHALSLNEVLDDDLASQRALAANNKAGKKRKFQEADAVLESGLTAKILQQARQQQQEIARELERETGAETTRQAFERAAAVVAASARQSAPSANTRGSVGAPKLQEDSDEEGEEEEGGKKLLGEEPEESEDEESEGAEGATAAKKGSKGRKGRGERGKGAGEGEGNEEGEAGSALGEFSDTASQYQDYARDVTDEDERAIALFLAPSSEAPHQRTLADVIREKIASADDKTGDADRSGLGPAPDLPPEMRAKVEAVYRGVGDILSRYTAGKVPKAFKLIPSLANWEEVLQLTNPERWTAPAMYAATRLFASNLNSRMAQRFYRLVLLPRIRLDIRQQKRLHFALYLALKKALYKPSAFFKGVLLPVCQTRTCTLREAVILGSVIQKVSIPVLHSSVALMRIAEMPYAGTNSYFMKLLFDKKYALPYRVVDACALHFTRFAEDPRDLPVIWHQCLLSFVQRYKNELTPEQKGELRALITKQHHYLMSPEIQRELNNSTKSRGEKDTADVFMSMAPAGSGGSKRQRMEEDVRDLPQVEIGMDED